MLKLFYDLIEKEFSKNNLINNRYEILSFIGKGSYGITYEVMDKDTDEIFILKQNRKRKRKSGKKSFEREAHILSTLNHPAIPKLLNHFEWKDSLFLVMERKNGLTLKQLIFDEKRKFTEIESFHILEKILDVVSYIHEKGFVHLDLRTPNILLHEEEIYIIDFGLANPISKSTFPKNKDPFKQPNIKNDLYELGHFTLFMLYSDFEPGPKHSKNDSWLKELPLSPKGKLILEKLLMLKTPYQSSKEVIRDINEMLYPLKNT